MAELRKKMKGRRSPVAGEEQAEKEERESAGGPKLGGGEDEDS